MGTVLPFVRTPKERKRLSLDVDGIVFTFSTRITVDLFDTIKRLDQGEVDLLPTLLKTMLLGTSTGTDPSDDFDAADFDIAEMMELFKEIGAAAGINPGESSPSSDGSSAAEGSSSTTSKPSTESTSTTSASELTLSDSFT